MRTISVADRPAEGSGEGIGRLYRCTGLKKADKDMVIRYYSMQIATITSVRDIPCASCNLHIPTKLVMQCSEAELRVKSIPRHFPGERSSGMGA